MSHASFYLVEQERSRLRTLLAAMESKCALFARQEITNDHQEAMDGIRASLAELRGLLALGPELEVRTCHACGCLGMLNAPRCGLCCVEFSSSSQEKIDSKEAATPTSFGVAAESTL
jgi:hypothetical protein